MNTRPHPLRCVLAAVRETEPSEPSDIVSESRQPTHVLPVRLGQKERKGSTRAGGQGGTLYQLHGVAVEDSQFHGITFPKGICDCEYGIAYASGLPVSSVGSFGNTIVR